MSTPSLHPPLPYLSCVQIRKKSMKRQKSLNIYKKVVVVVVGVGSQMACPKRPIFGLFSPSGEGGLSCPENFFGWNLLGRSQPPTQIIKWPRNSHLMGDNMRKHPKVIYTLATAGFSDLVDLKVGTSLAKAGNK